MTFFGLTWSTAVLLFGWIPFWWTIALISLYRMNQNDERNRRRANSAIDTDQGGGR